MESLWGNAVKDLETKKKPSTKKKKSLNGLRRGDEYSEGTAHLSLEAPLRVPYRRGKNRLRRNVSSLVVLMGCAPELRRVGLEGSVVS